MRLDGKSIFAVEELPFTKAELSKILDFTSLDVAIKSVVHTRLSVKNMIL